MRVRCPHCHNPVEILDESSRRESGEITMTVDGRVLITPAYMSPEQARINRVYWWVSAPVS